MDLSEITNVPFEIELNGTKFKARKVSLYKLEELSNKNKERVRKEHLSDIIELSKAFEGDEKVKFIKESKNDIPKGLELEKLASQKTANLEGVVDLIMACVIGDIDRKDIEPLITVENQTEWEKVFSQITGIKLSETPETLETPETPEDADAKKKS